MEQDWESTEGTKSEDDVIRVVRCRIVQASRMCCPEHGISQVTLMEIVGVIAGIPIEMTLELSKENAGRVGEVLVESSLP